MPSERRPWSSVQPGGGRKQLGWFYVRSTEVAEPVAPATLTTALLAAPGVTDVVPSYDNVFVEFDMGVTTEAALRGLVALLPTPTATSEHPEVGPKVVRVPTVYGGADGPDLAAVASATGLSQAAVIALHTAADYRVAAMGFMPGFAFMTGVHEALRLPRRPEPRAAVPAHSVAIANAQAGVYPLESPGGWNLLGRATVAMYDPHRPEPFLVAAGDTVRFEEAPPGSSPPGSPEPLRLLPVEPGQPALKVIAPGLLDLVVDQGRYLTGRYGLARSGPLDAPAAALANRLLGNEANAAVLEMTLKGPVLEAQRDLVVAVTGDALAPVIDGVKQASWTSLALRGGQTLSFAAAKEGCRAYLALAGGIEAGSFYGSKAVDLRGLVGSALVEGQVIGTAADRQVPAGRTFRPHARAGQVAKVRLVPGPQASVAALAALTSGTFEVGRSDRTGVRLVGSAMPGGEVVSEGVPLGAVQVTSSGVPIILLHDRGSLGGYHKPAVVLPADLAVVAQLRPHQLLRFVLTTDDRTSASSTSRPARRRVR